MLDFWGKFELAFLWKFRDEQITFGHQTQPALMREPLAASLTNTTPRLLISTDRLKDKK